VDVSYMQHDLDVVSGDERGVARNRVWVVPDIDVRMAERGRTHPEAQQFMKR
jgi:hypothetical protein